MKVFASVGPGLPHDLFAACPGYTGPLGWSVDRDMPFAERWLENRFPRWAGSILEDWAAGGFDHLEFVLFSRADDTAQRLYYYLCELRQTGAVAGPEPMIFDSAQAARASSLAWTSSSVRLLADLLQLDDDALEAGIALTNAQRSANRAPVPIAPVCLLAGSAPPDYRLHRLIAGAGWHPAGQTLDEQWRDPGGLVAHGSKDPCAAIACQLHAAPTGTRAFFDRGTAIVGAARAASARAVVIWLVAEEEGEVWNLPAQCEALANAGIPTLALSGRDWRARDNSGEEIVTFLEGLDR